MSSSPEASSPVQIREEWQLPRPLLVFLAVSVALTASSIVFSQICRKLGLGLPYSFAYYYVPGDLFSDLRGFWGKFQLYPKHDFFYGSRGYFMYPAPLFYVFYPFFAVHHAFVGFFALVTGTMSVLVYCFVKVMQRAGLAGRALAFFICASVLLSYPIAFEFLRLNVEMLVLAAVAAGVLLYCCKRPKLAAVCFGIAGALKLYPLMFLGIPFARKQYKQVALGVAVFAVINLVALWALGPTVLQAYRWDAFQLKLFQVRYAGHLSHVAYDHSFFGLIKVLTLPWRPDLTPWVPVYTRCAALGALLLYFTRLIRMPLWNQIVVLVTLAVTLPPVSYDYTLLSLEIVFALLSFLVVKSQVTRGSLSTSLQPHLLLLAVVFTPLSFVMYQGGRYGAQVRCLCLIALLWITVRTPIYEMDEHGNVLPAL